MDGLDRCGTAMGSNSRWRDAEGGMRGASLVRWSSLARHTMSFAPSSPERVTRLVLLERRHKPPPQLGAAVSFPSAPAMNHRSPSHERRLSCCLLEVVFVILCLDSLAAVSDDTCPLR